MSFKIDNNVLLTTAHVHATLQLLPHIIGPRNVWMPWMHANLAAGMTSNYMCSEKYLYQSYF